MRGLKASIALVLLTAVACLVLAGSVGKIRLPLFHDTSTSSSQREKPIGIVTYEGNFPAGINYEFADIGGIYHMKYDSRGEVNFYDIITGNSSLFLTPVKTGSKINAFSKDGNDIAWEEDNSAADDSEGPEDYDWEVYVRNDRRPYLVDRHIASDDDEYIGMQGVPGGLSLDGGYLVYRMYDSVPGMDSKGPVIKLYDFKKNKSRVIFSLADWSGVEISNPAICGDSVVWSTAKTQGGDDEGAEEAGLYIYSIKLNRYSKLAEGQNLKDPLIWQDYIVCRREGSSGPSIALLNIKSGVIRDIVYSDYSLFPRREVGDYSIGEGYVAWNSSYADSVCVYIIEKGEIVQLKNNGSTATVNHSLLNIRLYGKALLYTDHTFDRTSGKTISETNRYLVLK